MTSITQNIIVDATPSRVWEVLSDVTYVHHWHPKVDRSPAETSATSGVGAQRTCYFYDGTKVKEEVVLARQNERIEIVIVEASMPIRNAVAAFAIESEADGKTRVEVTMSYEMKLGPVGWLMDRLMVRKMMTRMLQDVLVGLRTHLEDGVYIGRDGAVLQAA